MGSELFIRTCYVELEDIIFDLVLHGRRSVIVSGTRGTGTSVFALYLLYQLRLQSKTVVLQAKEIWYRFSDEDGVQKWGPREAIRNSYLDDEDAWFLCEPEEKKGPFRSFHGVTVVTISPDPGRIHSYNKQVGPTQLFMPMWTLGELKQCRKLIFPHVPEDDVEFAYKHVGGAARQAFDKCCLTSEMERMRERVDNIRLEDLEKAVNACNSRFLITKMVGDTLLSIIPRDGYRSYDLMWASPNAMDMAMKALEEKQVNMADALLLANFLKPGAATEGEIGIFFERRAHAHLLYGRDDLRRYILGGDDVDSFSFRFYYSIKEFDGTGDLIPTTLEKKRYYKSTKKNVEAIDALGDIDDVLYIFQMKTSGAKFPVPLLTDEKLLAKWGKPRIENMWGEIGGYRKCVYVYVVPDVGSENFDKVVEEAKNHKWCEEPDQCPSARAKEEGDEGIEHDSQDAKAESLSMDEVWVIEIPLPPTSRTLEDDLSLMLSPVFGRSKSRRGAIGRERSGVEAGFTP